MSASDPSGRDNPDLFRALFQIFSDPQRLQWDLAAELARHIASEGGSPSNVDPLARIRVEELFRVAELRVSAASGMDTSVAGSVLSPVTVSPSEWATRTLEDWKPLLSLIADAHTQPIETTGDSGEEGAELPPVLAKVFGQAAQAIGPAMLGMQLGSSLGFLARRAFGQYELPIPRPPTEKLLFVPDNIATFAADWSLPADDVCLWVCMREIALHTVISREHVRSRILHCLEEYARHFSPDPTVIEDRISALDLGSVTDIEDLQRAFGDPSEILSKMATPEQRDAAQQTAAIVAALEGWVDHTTDIAGQTLISSYSSLAEALRRRRVERGESERYVDVLFGLSTDQEQIARGGAFVEGVVERAGEEGLARLWTRPEHLPTPAEVDAPGLWLERISFLD